MGLSNTLITSSISCAHDNLFTSFVFSICQYRASSVSMYIAAGTLSKDVECCRAVCYGPPRWQLWQATITWLVLHASVAADSAAATAAPPNPNVLHVASGTTSDLLFFLPNRRTQDKAVTASKSRLASYASWHSFRSSLSNHRTQHDI